MADTKIKTLNAHDRCDRCGAQAYIAAKGISGQLMFCAHHFTKHEEGIRKFAFELIDERDSLTPDTAAAHDEDFDDDLDDL